MLLYIYKFKQIYWIIYKITRCYLLSPGDFIVAVCQSVGGTCQKISLVIEWRQRRFDNFAGRKLVVDAAYLMVSSRSGVVLEETLPVEFVFHMFLLVGSFDALGGRLLFAFKCLQTVHLRP